VLRAHRGRRLLARPRALILIKYHLECGRILNQFAGSGRIYQLRRYCSDLDIIAYELEPEWAAMTRGVRVADALKLPLRDQSVDAIVTSPTYGNRMADHHHARDNSPRHTYTHTLGRELHPRNSGRLQWGEEYRTFHILAWAEAYRVLRPGGLLILNLKDHIRRGETQPVTFWHICAAQELGFRLIDEHCIPLPGQRHGSNAKLRVPYETVNVMKRT
jgi:hypothetical protein